MKIPKRLSIDIETLSSQSDAAVIQIGACVFDHENIHEKFQTYIDPIWTPGRRDLSTSIWWAEQGDEAKHQAFSGRQLPWDSAIEFIDWIRSLGTVDEVWANAPSFDLVILRSWYRQMGSTEFEKVLGFRNERDYRTVKAIAKTKGINTSINTTGRTKHVALDDAIMQAEVIQGWIREELIS